MDDRITTTPMRPLAPHSSPAHFILRTGLIAVAIVLFGVIFGISAGVLIADQLERLPAITFLPTVGPTEESLTATAFSRSLKATFFHLVTKDLLTRTPLATPPK
ncbi:MAG: hypothetical protein HS103_06815 [Anaerolineales bacterium]|nr:hypothetical protein [Anaerolineales bacterium]